MLTLTSCRADVAVDVAVDDDGSGTVTTTVRLDAPASDALLDLEPGLPVDDLVRSGWSVDPPERDDDGGTVLVASKDFGTAEQFSEVMDELDGMGGVLRSFRLERSKTFARVDHHLTGQLDPTGGFDSFADPELQALLGVSVAQLAEQAGARPQDVVVHLSADLPGNLRESPTSGTPDPGPRGTVSWTVTLADPAPVPVDAVATTRQVTPLVLRGVAVVAAVLAGLVLLAQGLRLLRPESRRGASSDPKPRVPTRGPMGGPLVPSAATAAPDPEVVVGEPKVVALDGMGVLYREGDDVARLLIPFARERGSLLTDKELAERARALSLGRITTSEFWAQVGALGPAEQLSHDYLALHQLNPGVVRFLRTLRQRGIRTACITNDAAPWATALRRRHSLEGLIDVWVISGAVGVRKPDIPIFEVLRRVAQVPANEILVIDDEPRNLDAARSLGFRTAWFRPQGPTDEANGHPVLRTLDLGVEPAAASSAAGPKAPSA